MRRSGGLAVVFVLLFALQAASQDIGQRLLDQFTYPHEQLLQQECSRIPLFERLKFQPCQFGYLGEIRAYADQKIIERRQRLEMERSRAWLWFNAPPAIGDCNTVPALEKAKFEFQCAPRQVSDGATGLFEVKLTQLQNQRDALAARIAIIQSDLADLSARASRQPTGLSPDVLAMAEILAKLDQADRRAALLQRFSVEAQRIQLVDLTVLPRIAIEAAPPGVDLHLEAGMDAPIAGKTPQTGDVVVVLGDAPSDPTSLILVHTDLGVVFANKSEFYAR